MKPFNGQRERGEKFIEALLDFLHYHILFMSICSRLTKDSPGKCGTCPLNMPKHLSKEPHAYQNTNLLLRVLQFKLTCEDANHYFSSVKAHEKQQIVSV